MIQVGVRLSWDWFCMCGEAGSGEDGSLGEAELAFARHARDTDAGKHYCGSAVGFELIEFHPGVAIMAFEHRLIDLSMSDLDGERYVDMRWGWLDE